MKITPVPYSLNETINASHERQSTFQRLRNSTDSLLDFSTGTKNNIKVQLRKVKQKSLKEKHRDVRPTVVMTVDLGSRVSKVGLRLRVLELRDEATGS